jgi:hypothetical protein
MKRVIFLVLISLGLSACIPPVGGGGGNRIKAKLIRVTCASKVIQILDSRYYYLGETWSDTQTPPVTYEHVAKVSNLCEFPESIAVGSEFFFKIDTNPQNNCAVCALWDAPPTKEVAVTVVP